MLLTQTRVQFIVEGRSFLGETLAPLILQDQRVFVDVFIDARYRTIDYFKGPLGLWVNAKQGDAVTRRQQNPLLVKLLPPTEANKLPLTEAQEFWRVSKHSFEDDFGLICGRVCLD